MKKKDRIINSTIEFLSLVPGKNLDSYLWAAGFQSSQGPWSERRHIEDGKFTQEAIDFAQENCIAEENCDVYFEAIDAIRDLMKANPSNYYLDPEEVQSWTDEDWECEYNDCDGFLYGAFQCYVYYCVQRAMDEIEEDIKFARKQMRQIPQIKEKKMKAIFA